MNKEGLIVVLCVLCNVCSGGLAKGEIRYWELSPADANVPPNQFVFANGLPLCNVARDDSKLYDELMQLQWGPGRHDFPDLRWELGRSALIFPVDGRAGIPKGVSALGEEATVLLSKSVPRDQGENSGYRIFVIEVPSSGVRRCDVFAEVPNPGTRLGVEAGGHREAFVSLSGKPSGEFISIPDLGRRSSDNLFALTWWDLAIAWEVEGGNPKEACFVAHDAKELLQILERFGWRKDANRFPAINWADATNALVVGSFYSSPPSSVIVNDKIAVVKLSQYNRIGPRTVFVIQIQKETRNCQSHREPIERWATVHSIQAPSEEYLREAPSHRYQSPEKVN